MVDLWVASKDVYSAKVGDDIALMNQYTSKYFTMNKTGSIVWDMVQEPAKTAEIVEAVCKKYNVSPEVCERDVHAILRSMHDAQLIKQG